MDLIFGDLHSLIMAMHALPAEAMGLISFIICALGVLLLHKIFGEFGLTVYVSIALVIANIQVLKAGQYTLFPEPVALGTVIFASIFLALDMLVEFYNAASARRAVLLGFASSLLLIILMLPALGVKPLITNNPELMHFNQAHDAMLVLFTPIPAILAASLISYLISQYTDIWIYNKINQLTAGKRLWLRAFLSNATSSLLDNIIFSILAWKLFSTYPVSWYTLFWTYIVGTYTIRILMGIMFIPVLYIAKLAHK